MSTSSSDEEDEVIATMKVTQLYVYPIKSLRGISVESSDITAQGLAYDRRFMLLKVQEDGTLKNMHVSGFYEMVLFHCKIKDGSILVEYHTPDPPIAPATASQQTILEIPAEPDCRALKRVRINMHGSPASSAYKMEDEYSQWFSECFGYEVILAYLGDGRRKALGSINPNVPDRDSLTAKLKSYANSKSTTVQVIANSTMATTGVLGAFAVWTISRTKFQMHGSQALSNAIAALLLIYYYLYTFIQGKPRSALISFSDCAPFLVVSEKSLEDVQSRIEDCDALKRKVLIERFRPNIVVDGEETWDEDFWGQLRIGKKNRIKLTANCGRCVSLNIDLDKGKLAAGDEGQVLKKLMKDRRIDPGNKYSPCFGRYGFPVGERGKIAVGDGVAVAKRNRERAVWDWPGL